MARGIERVPQATHAQENAFLLAAVGAAGERRESRRAPEEADGLDWAYVLAAADRQGIAPLLAHRAAQGAIALPPHVRERVDALYWATHFRTRTLMACVRRILTAAAAEALPVMPLKGAALVGWGYLPPALRPMSDLDLLVPPGAEARLGALLGALGFAAIPYRPPLVGGRHGAAAAEYTAVGMCDGMSVLVEYRSEPLDPAVGSLVAAAPALAAQLRTHAAAMWTRAATAPLDGVPGVRIAPEDLVLHIASHLTTRHTGLRLLWLHDLHAVVVAHGDALDWTALAARARALGIAHPVGAALAAAHRWLGTPLPAVAVARWPQWPGGGSLGGRAERRLLAGRVVSLGVADMAAAHAGTHQWQPLALAAARLHAAGSLWRAARWMTLPARPYMAWWCAAPVETAGAYARAVMFRAAYSALDAGVQLAARRGLPGRQAGDALRRRLRARTPFAAGNPPG